MSMIELRAVRQGSGTVDGDLYDTDPLRDAFGRFASGATLRFVDVGGSKQANYPKGQRVEVQYTTDGGSSWTTRLAGIVMDTNRTMKDGLPQLEVDIVAYDHLLRRRKVYKDYSGMTRSAILEDLITNFTSVRWVAGNVDVQNDETVDLPLRGERVDEAIDTLASGSADEEWGVSNSLEFFFRQQGATRAPSIGDRDVTDHDLPKKGEREINRFKLFYGASGDSFVTVEDRQSQLDLKEKLNAPRRVVISDSDTRTEVSTEERAKAIAKEQLGEREAVQTGTVRLPLGRFDTEPGDVVSVTISDAGIDGADFRVAQIDYNWQRAEVELTIAENVGSNIDDLLVSLSDSLSNTRARDADPNASGTDFLEQRTGAIVQRSATVRQDTLASDAFVAGFQASQPGFQADEKPGFAIASRDSSTTIESNAATKDLLNALRDLWQGEAAPGLSHLALGTADDAATRSDSVLVNEVDRRAFDLVTASGARSIAFQSPRIVEGALEGVTLREAGIFDADDGGTLFNRFTFGDITHAADTIESVDVTLTIDDDPEISGVVTTDGQGRLRDLLLGDTGHEPTDMAYGEGTTDLSESDTSLEGKVGETAIDSTKDGSTGITDVVDRLSTTDLNGTDIAKIGLENGADELLAEVLIEPYSKTSNAALETNLRFNARNA